MIDININVESAKEVVIVNTINSYIYVKSAPYKGLVEKAFANTKNEDIFVKTAMEREFVNMENKNICADCNGHGMCFHNKRKDFCEICCQIEFNN